MALEDDPRTNGAGSWEVPGPLRATAAVSWRVLVIGFLVYWLGWIIDFLSLVVLPLVLALFLTTLLQPISRWLSRRGVPRVLAALLTMLVAVALVSGALTLFTVAVVQEAPRIGATIDEGWDQLRQFVRSLPGDVTGGRFSSFVERAGEELRNNASVIASRVASGAVTAIRVASQILLMLLFAFFMVKDGPGMVSWFEEQFGLTRQRQIHEVGERAWGILASHIRGVSIIATFNAVMKGIALLVIGVPLILPIMLITFVGSYIPFAGPVIATVVAALVALASNGMTDALLVVAAGTGIQQIEGNILQPWILGRAEQLHPAVVVFAVSAGAVISGLAGAFLAVPIVAVAVSTTAYLREERARQKVDVDHEVIA